MFLANMQKTRIVRTIFCGCKQKFIDLYKVCVHGHPRGEARFSPWESPLRREHCKMQKAHFEV